MDQAVVLLSGGIDSTTTLAIAKTQGFALYAISFDYGQRHRRELEAASRIANHFGVRQHLVIAVDLKAIGGSALTTSIEVPKHEALDQSPVFVPITYVPARNLIFLSLALAWAEVLEAYHLFIGATAVDFSGYPDCRPEFLRSFEQTANLATKAGVSGKKFTVHAPLLHLSKAQIIRTGVELGVDYSLTWSCYDPQLDGTACGRCDSCLFRKNGFRQAGIPDPTRYHTSG
ncbi:MAG: 7-cyano-7-deazaguanine synthase QueC [candidate division KSB1 bacterium]|nr:7-cyano-7-deazaguanine synthase QueC [candidate division KSB1 bacterium]MDZ7334310.1 7-cyano-7-deazaguanine synthase QueC [candidate division KSB1 bacterium]MDZ7356472.1 7-cyano-7-deazaguanine synthase QueC [candidate division KSB1 bacterium]MDZ7374995.1 7-cyano-7-deazaguanine synthase QueC [candidate division KSB1 bacterium]MDZ7400479.1 7-cyano-7-deazaguanine synthase QueC [candidate division KSB1 bacterium]